ncbi:sugar transferase [Qipengyuania seohaensis]|uniref:sugar transferase n=1 Tax=Qipengyuania seohaensis TaxID=266951 RepID=UPI000C22C96E|nr:sugar transferase [Qipengyuania seohaensis]
MNENSTIANSAPIALLSTAEPKGIHPRTRIFQKYQLILVDFGAMIASIFIALWLNGLSVEHPTFNVATGSIPVLWICAAYFGAYSNSALVSYTRSVSGFAQGLIAAVSICLLFLFAVKATNQISRLSLSMGLFGGAIIATLFRFYLVRRNRRRTGTFVDRVIVFEDDVAIHQSENFGHVPVTHIDIGQILNNPAQFEAISQSVVGMDRVVVSCSRERRNEWSKLLRGLDVQGEIFDRALNEIGIVGTADLEGKRTFVVTPNALNLRQQLVKRLFDIFVASVAIILLSPILLAAAIAILIEDGRPVLFLQRRTGQGNRSFNIFKFRSMSHALRDDAATMVTSRNDPRVTRVGNFIRKTSIDELPQLFNVLLGHMSVVGPRPHAIVGRVQERLYWDIDPRYWERHKIKPGMTGLAQVRGFRGATHEERHLTDRVAADLEYLADWSILKDIRILFATLRVVVHDSAY